MRSRYTAYVLKQASYLRQTWYASTRPAENLFADNIPIKWVALEILRHEERGNDAIVEFLARYKIQGKSHKLHEISRFVREDGHWFYLDGVFPEP